MKIQIGLLVLFVACHLVKSNGLSKLTAFDDDFRAFDAVDTDERVDKVVGEIADEVVQVYSRKYKLYKKIEKTKSAIINSYRANARLYTNDVAVIFYYNR